jgi:hypothetical protein
MFAIAEFVATDFLLPVINVRCWHAITAPASVAMPETAMNEDGLFPADKGDIRFARKFFAVETIAF